MDENIIRDRYKLLEKIGQGGISVVYLALDIQLSKHVAVKKIYKHKDNDIIIQNSISAVNIFKKLDYQGLPKIYDIIHTVDALYIVMQYIEGKTLYEIIRKEGVQTEQKVIVWGIQLCKVLSYLHNCIPAIIYCDIKPSNIMVTSEEKLYLIDFECIKEYEKGSLKDVAWLGTRGYAAPEQYGEMGQIDPRADIYSFGITLYCLLTGINSVKTSFELVPVRQLKRDLSRGIEKVIIKCTKTFPNDRYQSCNEILHDLEMLYYLNHIKTLWNNFKLLISHKKEQCLVKNIEIKDIVITKKDVEYFAQVMENINGKESFYN